METDLTNKYYHPRSNKQSIPKLLLPKNKSDFHRTNNSQSTLDQETQLRSSVTFMEKMPQIQQFLTDRGEVMSQKREKQQRSKIRYSNQSSKFRRLSNNHDVFFAPNTIEIDKLKNIYKNSQLSIDFFQKEIKKFMDDVQNENSKQTMYFVILIIYTVSCIYEIAMRVQRKFRDMLNKLRNANKTENLYRVGQKIYSWKIKIQGIHVFVQLININTLGFSIFLNYQLAKVILLMQNPLQALQYFKQCKRLSDTEKYYKFKMKSYRQLGEILITINSDLAQLYLTKFLMAAWKLNDKKRELQGYDLLGKYYYYIGNMDKARQFHDRMISGKFEPENSQVRKLAVSKLNNGSLGKQKRHNYQHQDYLVTSDDENYEIIFPRNYVDEQGIKQISIDEVIENIKLSKKHVQKHKLRNQPAFENIEQRKTKIIYQKANENIKLKKHVFNSQLFENNEINLHKLQISKPNTKLGTCKDKSFLSHLTPNRNLQTYHQIELCKSSKSFLNSHQLNACFSPKQLKKKNQLFKKFNSIIAFLTQWVYQAQFSIIQNDKVKQNDGSPNRRRGYLIQQ